ncbi:MAG TPA: VOC family protein [Xanthomonadales bacterium]|nr:VOC family protein [Xanthomonadales bacterium]
MPRPIHFEIHAEQPERALAFYRDLFGWSFTRWDGPWPYWLISTGTEAPGIDGGLMQRRGPAPTEGAPCNAFVCTVGVEDLDAILARVESLGGRQVVDRMQVPGVGWLAYVHDSEGNILGLLQPEPMAG